jgi:ribonuclease T2
MQTMLNYIPTEALINHEWQSHGMCSGLGAEDFFYAIRKARDSLDIPPDLNGSSQMLELTPTQIEERFAAENRRFPAKAFRTTCYPDKYLQEVRVCLNRDLSPRPCGASAGACSATKVKIPPVQ